MAANCSHYAVICLPAVTTSCKVPHYLQRLTREAGPDRGTHGCPQSRRGPQTSPRGGPHAGPGHPGCGALSGPLPSAACGRAEGPRRGPWPGPQPVRRESLYKPPLSLVSRGRGAGGGGSRDAKSTSKKTSRATPRTLGADGAPETDRRAGRSSSAGWSSRPERGLAGNQGLSGSQLGPRRASRPRRGQSGQHPSSKTRPPGTSGSGTARGPRPTNGRNGSGEKDLR